MAIQYWEPNELPGMQASLQQSPFDASRAPKDVPMDWAEDFIRRNPGDYHRISEAYASDRQPKPQYATPTQQWNAQPAAQSPQSSELFKLLMERAQQPTTVDRNSATIRQQVDPVVAQQERASRNYIDDIAERSGPLANIQGERRLVAERSGQAAGALESEVIGRERDRVLQERMDSLGLAGQFMTAQERNALEREIAYLMDASRSADRDLSRQGLLTSNDQFLRELALREYDLNNTWDYRWQMGV